MAKKIVFALATLSAMPLSAEELADTSRVIDLDEVIVVSQPKETARLRLQPLSSSMFGQADMHRLQVRDLRDLSSYVPSFVMPQYGSRLTSSMYIRGLGSRISNSAVGVYYDNIPLMSPGMFNSHFYMIDRVDILRGPQGTLYGANSEGGIARIYSKNPMQYQGSDAVVSLGNGWQRNVEVAHFHRPSDRLAFSVAGFYRGQEGFFSNEYLDAKNDKSNEAGGKLRLMWVPTDRLTIDLTTDYQYTRQDAFPYGLYNMDEEWVNLPSTNLMPGYKRNMVNTGLNIGYQMEDLLLTSTTSYQFLRDRMDMDIDYTPQDRMALLQRQKMQAATEELTLRSTQTDAFWQHTTGVFGSRQWLRTDATVDFGRTILDPIGQGIESAMKAAMLQGMKAQMKAQMKAEIKAGMLAQGMPEAAAEAAAEKAAETAAQTAAEKAVEQSGVFMNADVMTVPNVFHQPVTNLAVYHESNLLLTDRLKTTFGLRLDYTKAELEYQSLGYMSITGGTAKAQATYTLRSQIENSHSTSFTQLLPKVGLTYRLDQHGSNVYASVSKGYMAGGYNIQLFSDILNADLNNPEAQRQAQRGDYDVPHTEQDYADIEEAITYKPEESWNYEVGTHLNLFSGSLQADAAVFLTQLRNQQLSVMAPNYGFGRMTVNAGKSRSMGLELALRGSAADNHLTWAATYSYTKATFTDYKDMKDVDGQQVEVDYKDNHIPYVPEHTVSALADYRFDLRNDGVLRGITLGVNVAGRGKTFWDDANTLSQKLYATLGAHARFDLGCINVDFWGRNLTATKYSSFVTYSGGFLGQRGLPLQFGVDVRLHL